jgi:segregation and condensation protein A
MAEFEVKTENFEGPFDLLLFFIKRDELDIHDIPIAKITDDFLAYVHQLERLNIDIASNFILTAATLMRIKAKMLLPRVEKDEEGNEIDPRAELVQHLIEYKRYRSALPYLSEQEEQMLQRHTRGNVDTELTQLAGKYQVETELQNVDLYKLLKVYRQLMLRHQQALEQPVHQVLQYPYTIRQQKEFLYGFISELQRVNFEQIIRHQPQRMAIIYNFLALLELVQAGDVRLIQGEGANNFWLEVEKQEREVA